MDLPAQVGKYGLEKFLGGGMSHVYRARDTVIGRTVAVKILSPQACSDVEAKARFLLEAQLCGNIAHENIVNVYDYGEDNGRPFIVMEFLVGQDLGHAIKNNETGDLNGKLRIALQIAEALKYLHSKEIIHRDIKPENVYLDASRKAKLMDFGIAKIEGLSTTRAGFTLGTPYYMAPEQLLGSSVTGAVDIYAFGILFYELLCGTKPFTSETVERLFYAILNEPLNPEPLRQVHVPQPIIDFVFRCTAKSAAERYPSFSVVVAALQDFLKTPAPQHHMTEAHHPTVIARLGALFKGVISLFPVPLRPSPVAESGSAAQAAGGPLDLPASPVPGPTAKSIGDTEAVPLPSPASPVELKSTPLVPPSPQPAGLGAEPRESTTASRRASEPAPPAPLHSAPDGATQLFRTVPSGGADEGMAHGVSPSVEGRPAEVTAIFEVPSLSGEGRSRVSAPQIVNPDVLLSISNCADSNYVGREVKMERFPFRIGRNEADLRLPFDGAISAAHAEIDFRDGGFTICDLGSSNGTFLDGTLLRARQPEPLLFGARILLGSSTQLTFGSNELGEIPDLTGMLIDSRYCLTEKLHSSAKSVVYVASDLKLPRTVVLKFLSPKLAQYRGYSDRFLREAKTAAKLRHPNICRVFDHGEASLADGSRSLYLCMDYFEGGSLSHRLAKNEKFDLKRIANWIHLISEALGYLHVQKVIHAAIKPSAIIFDGNDKPYLSDFTIAISPDDRERRVVIGAPGFLAPEQWDGTEITTATDLYSLGGVIYMALTGALPYEGQEHPEVRKRNFLRGLAPAHELAAQHGRSPFPAEISEVLKRAMSVDPASRFSSAQEFAQSFSDALTPAKPQSVRKIRVFVSYHRHSSSPWALLLKKELERDHGCEVFVDADQRDKVGNFPAKLERNIAKADVFVCLLAADTLASTWVQREIEIANQLKKALIPVFQESFEQPDLATVEPGVSELLASDGVKLLDLQNIYVDAALSRLAECVRQCWSE